jgi:E-phenylitaconyl-CoA hydratase
VRRVTSADAANPAAEPRDDLVRYELDGHVATITYNRPERLNAIDGAMRQALNTAFSRFRDEEDAWVAIVTGAGRAFCAGADLRGTGDPTGEFTGTFWERPTVNSFESGWEIFKPVIAAVNGYCIGYGFTLVTWCDFVIASERAEFGFPEVRLGVPTMVGAIRLPRKINWQYAMELLLTGERIGAERAHEIGLAGWVVPHEELMNEARALAARLVRGAPLAARAIKEVAVRTADPPGGRCDRGRRRGRGRRRRAPRAAVARPLSVPRDELEHPLDATPARAVHGGLS